MVRLSLSSSLFTAMVAMVDMLSGYKLVISHELGMYGIHSTLTLGRKHPWASVQQMPYIPRAHDITTTYLYRGYKYKQIAPYEVSTSLIHLLVGV